MSGLFSDVGALFKTFARALFYDYDFNDQTTPSKKLNPSVTKSSPYNFFTITTLFKIFARVFKKLKITSNQN